MHEHPDGVYVAMGMCQGCKQRMVLDGTPDAFRVRPHYDQRPVIRLQREEQARRAGKYVSYPMCPGSGMVPAANSVSLPSVRFGAPDD